MRTWPTDLRHAVRLLAGNRSLSLTALLTLALAIGATTSLFSIVDGILLRPVPFPEPDRLVQISEVHPGADAPVRGPLVTTFTLHHWTDSRTLEGIAAFGSTEVTWTKGDTALRLDGASLDPAAFALLRARPAAGRLLTPADAEPGAAPVVVISDRLWRDHFDASPGALGTTLRLDDRTHEIVGIARPGFAFPTDAALFWTPTRATKPGPQDVGVRQAFGRLRPGTTPDQAAAEGTAAARTAGRPVLMDLLLGKGGPPEVHVRTLLDAQTLRVRPALTILTAGVLLVLLAGCANVANLLLSRGVGRRRELAVRSALGAPRGRLVRLLLLDSLVLAAAGGALGLFLAWLAIGALPSLAPPSVPRLDNVAMNLRVLTAGILASLIAGVAAGLLPAIRAGRADLTTALKDGDARSAGPASSRLRFGLLVAESALAVVLIVGGALLVRGFVRLTQVDPGYRPAQVLTARVHLTGASAAPDRRVAFVESLVARLREAPGVIAAGAGNMAPFGDSIFISGIQSQADRIDIRAISHVVTPGYAEALGLRLQAGRFLQAADVAAGVDPVMVNETLARTTFTDGRPIVGRELDGLRDRRQRIVGIVADVLKDGPETAPQPELYSTHAPGHPITREIYLVIRTAGDPLAFAATLQGLVRAEDRYAAVDEIAPLADRLALSIAEPRFFAAILAAFAGLALALAAVGLYGTLSYFVSQRRRELGIRAALGAGQRELMAVVLRPGLGATALGLAAGTGLAWLASRLMQTLIVGLVPGDVVPFVVAAALLFLVAATACLVPARRAAATNPLQVLRHD